MPPEDFTTNPRPEDRTVALPDNFATALSSFARHDAAVQRHLALLARLRLARRENTELRGPLERLREHNQSALDEMRRLRLAAEEYTRALKTVGIPPEHALVLVRGAVAKIVAGLPIVERPHDSVALAADLVQCAIRAYYAA